MKTRKLLSIFLSIVMLISVLPIGSLPVYAASTDSSDTGLEAWAVGNNVIFVSLGETVTLEVDGTCEGSELHFQWYERKEVFYEDGTWRDVSKPIEGETNKTFTTPDITEAVYYSCEVSDGYGNSVNVWFNIYIANGIRAWAVGDTVIYVSLGETVTLEVDGVCEGSELHFQWYECKEVFYEDGTWRDVSKPIEGETNKTFTKPDITESVSYFCDVTDDYGNTDSVWFYIYIDNSFDAWAVGDEYVYVSLGETVTLEVDGTCEGSELHFQWYERKEVFCEDGTWRYVSKPIEGETNKTFTKPDITESVSYCCRVSDDYGNSVNVYFYIYIVSGLRAWAVGDIDIYVSLGETVTLEVDGACNGGELHFQWYEGIKVFDAGGSWWYNHKAIAGETKKTFTTPAITEYTEYYCRVSDDYGNSTGVCFYIYIDNGLEAWAVGDNEVFVKSGSTATLEVDGACNGGELHFQWYEGIKIVVPDIWWYIFEPIEGETNKTFTTSAITEITEYYCRVSDDYGNYVSIWFDIYVDKNPEHEFGEPIWNWSSDYSSATATFKCKTESEHVETLKAKVTSETMPATCTENGKTVYTATVEFNGKTYTATKNVTGAKATGHKWNNGVVTKQPTTTSEGVKTYTCTVCKVTKTEPIAKLTIIDTNTVKEKDGSVYSASGVTAADVIKAAGNGAKVLKADGKELKSTEKVGSGMTLVKPDGTKETIIVKGDTDGNGEITTSDARFALRTAVGLENPNGWKKNAADVDGKAEVSTSDARLILRCAVGLETLKLY